MGRNHLMPRKRAKICFTVVLFYFIAPDLLRYSPHTAPLADVVEWLGDIVGQGSASATFSLAVCAACSLVYDAYQWLTGRRAEPISATAPTPTPTELEEGAAMRAYRLAVLEAGVAGTLPPPPPSPPSTVTSTITSAATQITIDRKILFLIVSSAFFAWALPNLGIILQERPLLENVRTMAVFVLRGWEAVLVIELITTGVAWRQRQVQDAVDTSLVEALFEGTLSDEDLETPVEKEFQEKA